MKKLFFYILFIFFPLDIYALDLPTKANSINSFILNGWKILAEEKGDLNNDDQEDIAIIIENTNPDNFKKNEFLGAEFLNLNPRILLILFKKNNEYYLVAKNEKGLIESEGSEENPTLMDPFSEIKIKNNILKIESQYAQSAGSWEAQKLEYIFRFQQNHFELIGINSLSFMRNTGEGEKLSINLSTKKVQKVTGNIIEENQSKYKEKWAKVKTSQRYILDEMTPDTVIELFLQNNYFFME